MIPAGFSCSDCRFPGNGNSAEMGKVCQDGNWGLKSRHSASPANSFCSGESPFWQAGRASISCTVGLAAPLLYPEQHLMSEQPQAGGVSFQARVHPFSITYGLHLPEMFGGKAGRCLWRDVQSRLSPAPSLAWTQHQCCWYPRATCGKHHSLGVEQLQLLFSDTRKS